MKSVSIDLNSFGDFFNQVMFRVSSLSGYGIVLVVLAVFFPPLSVFLKVGFTIHFWINVILTLLGVVPGQLHALWVVLFM